MLLPDYDEEVFAPWASAGFDATTLHRLRLPIADLGPASDDDGIGYHWTGEQCREFARYFSRREAAMIENLFIFAFSIDGVTQALLLTTDTPYFDGHVDYLRLILAAVGEPSANAIRTRRLSHANALLQSIVFKPVEIPVVAERIASRASHGTRLLLVQLSDVVSQVVTFNSYLDTFRVWQDVLRATATLFASTASVCDANDRRALLFVHGAVDDDTELIVQHLAATLAHLFPELSTVPVLRYTAAMHPSDSGDIVALANSLL